GTRRSTWPASVAARDLTDSVLRAFQTLGSNRLRAVFEQAMSQELAFLDGRHRALGAVHTQLQMLFEISRHRRQHSFPRRQRPHLDVAVIRVAAEPMSTPFEFPIQVV